MRKCHSISQALLDKGSCRAGTALEVWQKENQIGLRWAMDEKLERSLERRRMEGSSLQADVMQKVPELSVHERMSQGEEVREMKDKPNSSLEEDAEEMRTSRLEPRGDRSMLEKVGQKNVGGSSGHVQGRG